MLRLARIFIILAAQLWSRAAGEPSPVICNQDGCLVTNYQGVWSDRTPCRAAMAAFPTTEQELVQIVAEAVKKNQSIKVVSGGSYSLPKLVCPRGESGLIISTRDFNRNIVVNRTGMTVSVDAGVRLRQLFDEIAKEGFTIPHAVYWEGVSVAGALSTGAHGSSLWGKGGAMHEYVVSVRLVIPGTEHDGFAKVAQISESDPLLNAAKVSIGVLGAISQVTFKLEPMFKRWVSLEVRSDENLESEIQSFAEEFEFGDIMWYPSLNKALFRLDTRVPVDTAGDGVNKYRGFQHMQAKDIERARAGEERLQNTQNRDILCKISETLLGSRVSAGNGLLNDGLVFTGFPVVGFNHRIQTAGGCQQDPTVDPEPLITPLGLNSGPECSPFNSEPETGGACIWDPHLNGSFFHQSAVSLPATQVSGFISDIKKLRTLAPASMCGLGLYGGIYFRFVKQSTAYLGQQHDGVDLDFTYFRAREDAQPTLDLDTVLEIEQMAFIRYAGKPHWGKNRPVAFRDLGHRVTNLEKFLNAKKMLDPSAIFSSEWSDFVLGISPDFAPSMAMADGCALEGNCICSQDRHCAPQKGYFCRSGKVFTEARVCRYQNLSSA